MANMRAIRTRIKSIENTRQITRSMRMVAASKLRRTQETSRGLGEFAAAAREMLARLTAGGRAFRCPLLRPHESGEKLCYVLFVGNRGLCGVYNSSLLKYLEEQAAGEGGGSLVVVGRWGREQIAASGLPLLRRFDAVSDTPDGEDARELAAYLKELYLSGQADRIVLVYQHFRSVLAQDPVRLTLLPMEAAEQKGEAPDVIFEPDAEALMEELSELVFQHTVYSVLLEAKTGEHAARMTAMTAASDNTDELIQKLSLQLNHARQAAITTEITEIVGGSAALNHP